MADQSRKGDTQAQIVKAQRAEDGRKAMAEYEAAAVATREKTERLRALRLAREAEQVRSAPQPAARSPRKSSKGGAKSAAGKSAAKPATLSAWLKDRSDSGYKS